MLILQELSGKQKRILTLSSAVAAIAIVVILCLYLQPHQYPKELASIDSLSESRPDSALKLLKRLPERSLDNDADRMYYALLKIKTANNLYEPQKDSTIFRVCDFFEDSRDKDKYRESCYYLGKYYVEHSDAPQALKCFQTALDLSDDKTPLSFKSKVYSQSGTLFLEQDMYDEALTMYRKSYSCDSLLRDTVDIVNGLRDMAQVYRHLNNISEGKKLLSEAYSLSKRTDNKILFQSVSLVLSSLLMRNGEIQAAHKILSEDLFDVDEQLQSPVNCLAMEIYAEEGKKETACSFANRILINGSLSAKCAALKQLALHFSSLGNQKYANWYLKEYFSLSDSLQTVNRQMTVAKVHSLYNYGLREKENSKLKIRNNEIVYQIYLLLLLSLLVISFLAYCIIRRNKKILELEYFNERMSVLYEKVRKESLRDLSPNSSEKVKNEDITLQMPHDGLEEKDEGAEKLRIFDIIKNSINNGRNISSGDWSEIDIAMSSLYPDFKKKLYMLSNLSVRDYRICILVKLGFQNSEISTVMHRGQSTISYNRASLYRKLTKEEGGAKDFDEFIRRL